MIALRLVKQPDGSVPALAPRALDANGVTIGRSPQCGLVLADPLRGVSRKHAWIAVQRGGETALLRCISTTTPLAVNGKPLDPGGEQLVKPGDRLRIGGFELQLEDSELTTIPLPVARAPMAVPPTLAVAPPAMPATGLPAPARRSRLDALWDVETAPDPLGFESPLPLAIGMQAPSFSSPARALPPAPIATAVAPTLAAPQVTVVSEPPPSARSDDGAAPDLDALRQAFLRGAGLSDALPGGAIQIDAEWMEHLGALLRAAVEGTLALLNSRALTKRSIRAEGTRIAAQENNPLKFAPDGAEALALLLRLHSARGFLDPVDALNDAHDDLQVHQLAMAAGMRAAVFELISRLGPNALEAGAAPQGGRSRLFPNAHDAALWRRHRDQHAHLLEHFDDDFEAVFGREFVRAYEEQARLAAARRNRL
ncbi:MAG TPA: type VI secretion system-associated FHA domain protein TagH [Burkholderiaceae bacterium]